MKYRKGGKGNRCFCKKKEVFRDKIEGGSDF